MFSAQRNGAKMEIYRLRFYEDVARHFETTPCRIHDRTFPTIDLAEAQAKKMMPKIRAEHGIKAGYVVLDPDNHDVAMGGLEEPLGQ